MYFEARGEMKRKIRFKLPTLHNYDNSCSNFICQSDTIWRQQIRAIKNKNKLDDRKIITDFRDFKILSNPALTRRTLFSYYSDNTDADTIPVDRLN